MAENILVVQDSVMVSPSKSIRRRSQQLHISPTALYPILKKDLSLHPYKIQLTQELKPLNHWKSLRFAQWVLKRQAGDVDLTKKNYFFS